MGILDLEIVDNLFILVVPGGHRRRARRPAVLVEPRVGLLIAGVIAYPVNRWLIARGQGHAVVHAHHAG